MYYPEMIIKLNAFLCPEFCSIFSDPYIKWYPSISLPKPYNIIHGLPICGCTWFNLFVLVFLCTGNSKSDWCFYSEMELTMGHRPCANSVDDELAAEENNGR